MANKRRIRQHTDKGFISGFGRYQLAICIRDCKTWRDLEKTLATDELKQSLLGEIRLHSAVLVIEYGLISFIENNNDDSKSRGLETHLANKLKQYRGLRSLDRSRKKLLKEGGKKVVHLSPHVLLHVCGLGLGDLIHLIRDFCKSFDSKDRLLKELDRLNESRTILIHNLASSRIIASKEVSRGLLAAAEIESLIKPE